MAVLTEKTTAKVKKGVAYFEGEGFTISNIDKVKTIDYSAYAHITSLNYSRSGNDLEIKAYYYGTVTIKDYFNSKGAAVSTVKTIRVYDGSAKKGYKDYNLLSSGLLNHIDSGIENFAIKKGVITGTAFADTISAEDFNKPTGKKKNIGVTIKTGSGNDNVTGSAYNDTFNINGSGSKTINTNGGSDTIKGVNTKDTSLRLNIPNTISDYQRVGNDLKITATASESSTTTTIKDYFKNSTAPDVRLNGYNLLSNLNSTDLVYIDKHTQTKKQNIKGTFLNDVITGSKKADKITSGKGTDTITGGRGNDKITLDGSGSKYIIMNTVDGVDTLNIKKDSNASAYIQFKDANITSSSTARTNVTYEKSGKNDLKITSKIESNAMVAPSGYISNSGIGTDKVTFYFTTGTHSYYREITDATGLYSYEADGETIYTTEKNETKALSSAKLVINISQNNTVGFLTDSNEYDGEYYAASYTTTSLSEKTTLYAYMCKNYTGNYEYAYSTSPVTATKYSDLWLKSNGSYGQYNFVTEYTDGCIAVNSRTAIYTGHGFVSLERMYEGQEEVSQDRYNSTYFIDNDHLQVVDIDNNSGTEIYKAFTISNSYYLKLPNNVYFSNDKGMAITSALTENSYTKIENIYKTTDNDGNVTYSITKPANFKEKIESTSVIVKDYLKNDQYLYLTNSNSYSSYDVSNILNEIGLNIGNANSKKAQKITGSRLNDNLYGGSGKDKIITGASSPYSRGDIITAGKGNDTITINGEGNKYIVMNSGDGTDTVNIKNDSATTYIQFAGAGSYNVLDLNYEKSGKNDIKITYTDSPMKQHNNLAGLYFYDKYGSDEFILFTQQTMYSESDDYFTEISSTGLYSYENEDGGTSYSTHKTETVALNTVYFETIKLNGTAVGYLTSEPHVYQDYYTTTALSDNQKVYAYKNTVAPSYTANGKQITEVIYTIDPTVTPTKYSDLWLKPMNDGYSDYYYVIVKEKENDDCIKVSDQDALYSYNDVPSYSTDRRIYLNDHEGYLAAFITSDKYDSVFYFDSTYSYITDIDDDSTNGLYKEYTISDSYFLLRNGVGNEYMLKGDATTKALSSSDYTQINIVYSSKDTDGNITYTVQKPEGFDDTKSVDTSVIIKDYLKNGLMYV